MNQADHISNHSVSKHAIKSKTIRLDNLQEKLLSFLTNVLQSYQIPLVKHYETNNEATLGQLGPYNDFEERNRINYDSQCTSNADNNIDDSLQRNYFPLSNFRKQYLLSSSCNYCSDNTRALVKRSIPNKQVMSIRTSKTVIKDFAMSRWKPSIQANRVIFKLSS